MSGKVGRNTGFPHLHRSLRVVENFVEQCAIRCIRGEGCARRPCRGGLKEKSGKNDLCIKSPPLCVLVRCQLTGAVFLQEGVLEHKPVTVGGGHDFSCG